MCLSIATDNIATQGKFIGEALSFARRQYITHRASFRII
jgi:hypothetical protein